MNISAIFSFILLGVLSSFVYFFVKTYRLSKSKNNTEGMRNSIILIILVIWIVLFYLVNSILIGCPLIAYPFDALILIWAGIILAAQLIFKKFHKERKVIEGTYKPKDEFTYLDEVQRKATHLFILLLIAVYFGLGGLVYDLIDFLIITIEQNNLINIWGITSLQFPREHSMITIALMGMLGAFFLILIPEIFRLFSPDDYMLSKAPKLMRANEQFAPSAPVSLIIASTLPFVTIPIFNIALAGVTIAVIGDAFASILGRKYGKHKISIFPSKSYEGLLAGSVSAFLAGLPILIFQFDLLDSIVLSLIGAIIIGFIDLLDIKISDNIMNPISVSFSLYLFSFLL